MTGTDGALAVDAPGGFLIAVPPAQRAALERYRGQPVTLGIRPEGYKIVIAKGVQSPRPAYEPIAAEIILANTPGVTTADLSFFEYRHRRRPLYPFEPEAEYA